MSLTPPVKGLDEMVRLIAVYATACDDVSPVVLLASCQLCRNHLLYLLDTIPLYDDGEAGTVIVARLRALPEDHKTHGQPGHPDNQTPQIRWVLT